ncbi:MAG: PPC domain-containing protein [Anaerolineae bacterium]|nr:PPC domain-containing protein [Anaerolineae bacterium]
MTRTELLFRLGLFWLAVILCAAPLAAQDDPAETPLEFAGTITGEITNADPLQTYFFEGLRGEVISLRVTVTRGDLDPLLTVVDANGTLLASRDDGDGRRDITIDALTLPRSDRYYIIIGRFGYGLGSTVGVFEMNVERIGVSSESGSALRYGDSVINNISAMMPQLYYSFRAEEGDILDIIMRRASGDLDPYLQVVNSRAFVIADNDDAVGSGSLDAQIRGLVIEETGTYIIIATRYGEASGTSTGRFILTLDEASNSGLGNAAQTAIALSINQTLDDEITNDSVIRYYAFDARKDDLLTVRMNRLSGSLDAFLVITDSNLQELIVDDDGGGGQNAQIQSFRVPEDGRYYILATRLDREAGTTVGRYRLEFQSLGNAFDGVPPEVQRISFGTTITGRIDDLTPELRFAFWGQEGEAVTVSLNRGDGDLDPVVSIVSADGRVLAEDDDSGGGQNARIARYVLPATSIYYVRAARFSGTDGNPNTQGSFVLVLARIVR